MEQSPRPSVGSVQESAGTCVPHPQTLYMKGKQRKEKGVKGEGGYTPSITNFWLRPRSILSHKLTYT